MEDVVLHYRPGSTAGLNTLVETTQKLLESFPCRTPPVFTPWFTSDRHLPIRPARPAPIIASDALVSESRPAQNKKTQKPEVVVAERPHEHTHAEESRSSHEHPQKHNDDVTEMTTSLLKVPVRDATRSSPEGLETGVSVKRSWSVFVQKRVPLQRTQPPSKRFHRMVSNHRLHLRQRAKWVIRRHNCGAAGDIEQVWQALNRSVRNSSLPTCNANIQRERAEIWVFCDVVHAERVGRLLKDELQLSGTISLSVHRLGDVFTV